MSIIKKNCLVDEKKQKDGEVEIEKGASDDDVAQDESPPSSPCEKKQKAAV
jgi:hypothetical protein